MFNYSYNKWNVGWIQSHRCEKKKQVCNMEIAQVTSPHPDSHEHTS